MVDISIIIPVYNTEAYLKRCVDSVIMQQNVKLEIILVDDGSTDDSPNICDNYSVNYPFIKTIHIDNSGPSTAKNVGYDIAIGNYIAFIDSDDEIRPDMFCTMLKSAYNHNADIVCCNYIQVDEDGNLSHTEYTDKEYVLNQDEALKAILIKDKIYSQCWTKIYRRATLEKYHIINTEGLKTEEDFIFNIQAFAKSHIVSIVDKPLYIYTHRTKSLSKNYYKNHINQYIDNRILRLNLVDNTIRNNFPHLLEYSTYHCIFYYNELLGRICLFPKLFNDKRVHKVLTYIRNHSNTLKTYHSRLGFSKIGVFLIQNLPDYIYLSYRRLKYKSK
jgi:glycosyltransferase involved in cell wall biosynthesis